MDEFRLRTVWVAGTTNETLIANLRTNGNNDIDLTKVFV